MAHAIIQAEKLKYMRIVESIIKIFLVAITIFLLSCSNSKSNDRLEASLKPENPNKALMSVR